MQHFNSTLYRKLFLKIIKLGNYLCVNSYILSTMQVKFLTGSLDVLASSRNPDNPTEMCGLSSLLEFSSIENRYHLQIPTDFALLSL